MLAVAELAIELRGGVPVISVTAEYVSGYVRTDPVSAVFVKASCSVSLQQ